MHGHDYDEAGKAAILVTSPWGIGLLGRSGGGFTSRAMAASGTRLGPWSLNTRDDHVAALGDFDGDGRAEVLLTSPWGVGVIERSGAGWDCPSLAANGTRIGGWMVDSTSNRFQAVGDLDQDGRTEILATSPWGIGLMKKIGATLDCPLLVPNGSRIGGWLLDTADNAFPIAADLDGDGATELLVRSGWGIAILRFNGVGLSQLWIAANGTRLGDWVLDTAVDRFELAADLDGDGRAEILVAGPAGLGVLGWRDGALVSKAKVDDGSWIGPWRLETGKNRFGPAAAFGGTGRPEVLLASPWGIGVLAWQGGGLTVPALAPNDARLGAWRLNTRDNRFNVAGDYEGGGARVLISSPWGMGLLRRDGSGLVVEPMTENGTRLGDWLLDTGDNDLEAGSWRGTALVAFHNDWKWSIDQARPRWQRRGLASDETGDGAAFLARLRAYATAARAGDRMFVYLAGHGADPRPFGNTDPALAAGHIIQFNSGQIRLGDVSPLFETLANRGVDLSVLDGSCNGGETVIQATGERYCAMATTGVNSPGLTGFPAMHDALDAELRPSAFAWWWGAPRNLGSALNGVIVRGVPTRFHQRLHRNDASPLANAWFRSAVDVFKCLDLGGWNLRHLYCYLYPHIYRTEYAALPAHERARFTRDTQSFVDTIDGLVDACRPTVAALDAVLADSALMSRAARVYAGSFTAAWRALAGDAGWNVLGAPALYKASLSDLSPADWQGEAGLHAMAADLRATLAQIQAWYADQKALLWAIDAAVKAEARRRLVTIPRLESERLPVRLPGDPRYFVEYNELERRLNVRSVDLLTHARDLRVTSRTRHRTELARVKAVINAGSRKRLNAVVAEFKAITVVHLAALGRASFLLSLVEDAVAGAEAGGGAHPGDVVRV